MSATVRRVHALLAGAAMLLALVPAAARAEPAHVTLVGSFQAELGCPADWDPGCMATRLTRTGPATFSGTFTVPAGSFEYAVATSERGEGVAATGTNDDHRPLVVGGPARLEFRYDDRTGATTVTPEDLASRRVTRADRVLAAPVPGPDRSADADAPRAEQVYAVVIDRFANGDPRNDPAVVADEEPAPAPDDPAALHGGDLRGILDRLDYIRGLGTTVIWLTSPFPPGADGTPPDVTRPDPRFGTADDLAALVAGAHARQMKVVVDVGPDPDGALAAAARRAWRDIDGFGTPGVGAGGLGRVDTGFSDQVVAMAGGGPTRGLADAFAADDTLPDPDAATLLTRISGADTGRIGHLVPGTTERERLTRVMFATALMFTLRGQPVVLYGDEQGLTGSGAGDGARQDLFATAVPGYAREMVLGGPEGSLDRYATGAPLYRYIAALAGLRAAHPALADGAQVTRFASDRPGILAVSRIDRDAQVEYLVVANDSPVSASASFPTATPGGTFLSVHGGGSPVQADDQGAAWVSVPPLTVRVFRADQPLAPGAEPRITIVSPQPGATVAGDVELRVTVPGGAPVEVVLAQRVVGARQWHVVGSDDAAPYRVFHDFSAVPPGTLVEYRAIVRDAAGRLAVRSWPVTVGSGAPSTAPGLDDVAQPAGVRLVGDVAAEMGCAPADPACAAARLSLDVDRIWKTTVPLPGGSVAYDVAVDPGRGDPASAAVGRTVGHTVDVPSGGADVTFLYDHRTGNVATSRDLVGVAVGSFQSEMGCAADWDPGCMRAWLQDPDRDGELTLATSQIPPGRYELAVAVTSDAAQGGPAGGGARSAVTAFTVESAGSVTTFRWRGGAAAPRVAVSPPPPEPDPAVPGARWLDARTLAYPAGRLPDGSDPAALRFRLHRGDDLAVDAMSLGGTAVQLSQVPPSELPDSAGSGQAPHGLAPGELVLRVPASYDPPDRPAAGQQAQAEAIGVYDDADRLVDATGVAPAVRSGAGSPGPP